MNAMKVATGKSILNGIAIGTIRCFRRREVRVEARSKLTPGEELARFEQARREAQAQLKELYDSALAEVGSWTRIRRRDYGAAAAWSVRAHEVCRILDAIGLC